MTRWYRPALLATLLTLCGTTMAQPRLAIVLDDLGYRRGLSLRAIDLPRNVTLAVIPSSPHARELARLAAERRHEVLVHLPMAAAGQRLDPGGIAPGMSAQAMARALREAFEAVPQARGLNNHMGSQATADPDTMRTLMRALATRHVFFLDSRTIGSSVAQREAERYGLPHLGRDVFLDNVRTPEAINEQFNQLLHIARQRGQAIAIGHPYPETLDYLEQVLPMLEDMGYELVPLASLLPERWHQARPRFMPPDERRLSQSAATRD